jgi:hypothetical protein
MARGPWAFASPKDRAAYPVFNRAAGQPGTGTLPRMAHDPMPRMARGPSSGLLGLLPCADDLVSRWPTRACRRLHASPSFIYLKRKEKNSPCAERGCLRRQPGLYPASDRGLPTPAETPERVSRGPLGPLGEGLSLQAALGLPRSAGACCLPGQQPCRKRTPLCSAPHRRMQSLGRGEDTGLLGPPALYSLCRLRSRASLHPRISHLRGDGIDSPATRLRARPSTTQSIRRPSPHGK